MKAWNWYYNSGRHTRSDRSFKEGTCEPSYRGIRLLSDNKHMDIDLSEAELTELINGLIRMQVIRNT